MEVVFILNISIVWFGHLSLILKFEEDLTSDKFHFKYLRSSSIGGGLQLKVVFHCRVFFPLEVFFHWFGHISLCLKFGEDPTNFNFKLAIYTLDKLTMMMWMMMCMQLGNAVVDIAASSQT